MKLTIRTRLLCSRNICKIRFYCRKEGTVEDKTATAAAASSETGLTPFIPKISAWALSVGTAIGWGSMFVTSNTYLMQAGPLGTIFGLVIGALIMIVIGRNYHYMMNCFPDAGGAYTYAKEVFGYDHGFVAAWFLSLTYISIFWANVTALPLFSRYFFGDFFRHGYLYTLFGSYDVYLGEALLSMSAIIIFCVLTASYKKFSVRLLTATVILFTLGIIICILGCMPQMVAYNKSFSPGYIPEKSEISQIIRIASISPWAFIGFENISNMTEELSFPRSKVFRILTIAIVSSTALYIFITLLSITAYPSEYGSWLNYIRAHGELEGLRGLPPFYAADYYLGDTGVRILMISLLCIIISSLIGNVMALSRLMYSLAKDSVLPDRIAWLSSQGTPANAVALIAIISLFIPFLGRTAIGWIVDVTTIGATIVYAFVSATAFKLASRRDDIFEKRCGLTGVIIMAVFLMLLLIPAIFGSGSLAPETYFLFTVWAILGFLFFRIILRRDIKKRFGRSVIVWIALLGMIMFTALVWMGESAMNSSEQTVADIRSTYMERIVNDARKLKLAEDPDIDSKTLESEINEYTVDVTTEDALLEEDLEDMRNANTRRVVIVFTLFLMAIGILLNNYSVVIRRSEENEYELGVVREKASTDALTGVKNKRIYDDYETSINKHISEGVADEFSVVVCDINGLKYVNDTYGHKAGDDLIRSACTMICHVFAHSPVFRIGGDEFVVILTGRDRVERGALMHEIGRRSEENLKNVGVVVAAGMSDFIPGYDETIKPVFERADLMMYERKEELKEMGAVSR